MMDSVENDLREIGRVGKPHGVRGEVKVIPATHGPEPSLGISTVFVGSDASLSRKYDVSSFRSQITGKGRTIILGLRQITDRDVVETMRGQAVYARAADLTDVEVPEGRERDVTGYSVSTKDGPILGTVKEVISRPPQDLVVLLTHDGQEVLIPFVDAFITEIDDANRLLVVSLIEGLIEE
jgi:16S rRNA processing protein RimM